MNCTLCRQPISCVTDDSANKKSFCCNGCLVVYQILSSQSSLENYENHPIFTQALEAGFISNPALKPLKKKETSTPQDEIQKIRFSILNMWCPSCAHIIAFFLMKEEGIIECNVDYSMDLASVHFSPRTMTKEKIFNTIIRLGYRPEFLDELKQGKVDRPLMLRFIIAAFFSLNIMMFAYPIYATTFTEGDGNGYAHLFAWLSLIGSLPVLLYSGWPIWKRSMIGLRTGFCGMDLLVSVGVAAATILSLYEMFHHRPNVYFDSLTVIIMFVLLGKILETRAKFKAKDALIDLSLCLPKKGRKLLANGEEAFCLIKDFSRDDLLSVKMGEKIALDGSVVEGSGQCDESLMTGESKPVFKHKGSSVISGSLLQRGSLIIRVTATEEHSTLHHIIEMISQDIDQKATYKRETDRIVKWFVPLVFFLAIATFAVCCFFEMMDKELSPFQTGLLRAISILLISCPCAIGIAVPLGEAYLINHLAKKGMIVRNRNCLQHLGNQSVFVFDKTGTMTEGKFLIHSGLESLSMDEKIFLKSLVQTSNHPIAMAIYQDLLCPLTAVQGDKVMQDIEEISGKGMIGFFEGVRYILGSANFIEELGLKIKATKYNSAETIATTVYFAKGIECLTAITLGDRIKKEAKHCIQKLKPAKTILLSGDSEEPVIKVARACGMDEWKFGHSPLQKKNVIDNLKKQGEIVAMFGDGINDAPALTAAHIGIAIFSASDTSIQVSDLLLTSDKLGTLPSLFSFAKRGKRVIKQNLFWAFFYNCIGLGVACMGLMTPLFSAIAMVVSSTIILINTQRLR